MKPPHISNPIKDPESDVTYNVMAYRQLSQSEVAHAVRYYLSQAKKRKPKPGSTITIFTVIGVNE